MNELQSFLLGMNEFQGFFLIVFSVSVVWLCGLWFVLAGHGSLNRKLFPIQESCYRISLYVVGFLFWEMTARLIKVMFIHSHIHSQGKMSIFMLFSRYGWILSIPLVILLLVYFCGLYFNKPRICSQAKVIGAFVLSFCAGVYAIWFFPWPIAGTIIWVIGFWIIVPSDDTCDSDGAEDEKTTTRVFWIEKDGVGSNQVSKYDPEKHSSQSFRFCCFDIKGLIIIAGPICFQDHGVLHTAIKEEMVKIPEYSDCNFNKSNARMVRIMVGAGIAESGRVEYWNSVTLNVSTPISDLRPEIAQALGLGCFEIAQKERSRKRSERRILKITLWICLVCFILSVLGIGVTLSQFTFKFTEYFLLAPTGPLFFALCFGTASLILFQEIAEKGVVNQGFLKVLLRIFFCFSVMWIVIIIYIWAWSSYILGQLK